MRKRKVMIIGPARCGKTSLANKLNGLNIEPKRFQDVVYGKNTIDVPASYLECPWMYKHIIAIVQNDASHVLILVDQSRYVETYSPGFARTFNCPVTGVIMKSDLMPENRELCMRQLKNTGVDEPYFSVSLKENTGIEELREYIFHKSET